MKSSSSSMNCCNWFEPASVHQSRHALNLFTDSALTTLLGKLFNKLADLLKKDLYEPDL